MPQVDERHISLTRSTERYSRGLTRRKGGACLTIFSATSHWHRNESLRGVHNRVGARGLFPRASSHTTWRTVLVPRGCEQSSELPPSSLFFCLHPLFPLPTSVDNSVPQSSHSEALPCGAFRQPRKRCMQQEETDSLRSFLELRVL